MPIKNNIKEFRNNSEITQAKMADDLNITQVYLSCLESGNRTPSLGIAFNIAEYFEVTLDDMFFKSDN